MLYLAISSCARPDSASASPANSVDSALASSARMLLSIRSSAGTAVAAPPWAAGARLGGAVRGCAGGAGQREEPLEGGQMVERVQRLDRGRDGGDELGVAAEPVPGAEI